MASSLSAEAQRILGGLLAGQSLAELAPEESPARAEVESYLRGALGDESVRAARGEKKVAPKSVDHLRHGAADRDGRPLPGRAIAYSDGASRGNPGPAAYGIRILAPDETELVAEGCAIGDATNNVAEYRGVVAVLERAAELGVEELELRLDSELIVKQMRGIYRVKQPALQQLKAQVDRLVRRFRRVEVKHVRREFNSEADALANEALDALK